MVLCRESTQKKKEVQCDHGGQRLPGTRSLKDKISQNESPRLLTVVPINIDQNEPMDTKKKKIYR